MIMIRWKSGCLLMCSYAQSVADCLIAANSYFRSESLHWPDL